MRANPAVSQLRWTMIALAFFATLINYLDGKRLPVKVIDEGGEERQGNHRPSQLGHCWVGPHTRFIRITARGMLFTASHRVLLKRSFLPRNKDIPIQA